MHITGWTQDRGACTRIRIWQPLKRIARLGLAEVHLLELSDDNPDGIIDKTDIALIGRTAGPNAVSVIKRLQSKGKKVVYDLDDNYMAIHPLSPHYKSLGIMPVEMLSADGKTATPMWVDKVRGFDLRRNRDVRKAFPEILRTVDAMTVTNEQLQKIYSRFNDNVFVTPNAIDFREWGGAISKHPGKDVRVLYTGAANHQEDFLWVRKPLEELQKKHDNVTIVFVGTDWKHMGNDLDYNRVEVHAWVDIDAYPYLMKSLACHIGIAPISESSFNDCRSELKWMEYSALKMATVATNYGPYKRSMVDGKTGLLVMEQDEWLDALSTLVEKPRLRNMLGRNAYREVWRKHNLDFVVETWMKVFADLMVPRK